MLLVLGMYRPNSNRVREGIETVWAGITNKLLLHRENGNKKSLSGKQREFGNFAKTQGICIAHVVNSMNLKVKDICCKNLKKIVEA